MCDECQCHEHGVGLFSRTHSNLYGEWEQLPVHVPDDNNTLEKRETYQKEPTFEHLLSLGGALFFQLRYREALAIYNECVTMNPTNFLAHRKRAITYLKLLKFNDAYQEFKECLTLLPNTSINTSINTNTNINNNFLDITYRLALCQYYLGHYDVALEHFRACFPLAQDNPDMYVSSLYWFKLCLIKLNKSDDTEFKSYRKQYKNNFYTHPGYDLFIKYVSEEIDLDELEYQADGLSLLQQTCAYYGMSVYYASRQERYARRYLKLTLSAEDYFGGFAYIAAYMDQKNKGKNS